MSRSFTGSANGSFLSSDQAVVLAPPFSVSVWFRTSNAARNGTLFYLGDRSSASDWFAVSLVSAGKVRAEARSPSAWPLAPTGNLVAAEAPQHVAAVFASSTSRKCVLNGDFTNAGTNATACTPATPNRTAIGALRDSTPTSGFLGDIGYVAVWKRVLTDSEITLLSKGTHPQDFSTDLVEVWVINGTDDPETGLMGSGLKMAVTGAAVGTFDPPVSDPAPAAGGTPVSKVWTSGLLGKRYAATRESFLEWDAQTIPDIPGGRLYAMVSLQPFADATALDAVKFAGTAMTRINPDIYDGPEKAANITAWVVDMDDLASNTGVPRAECDKDLWSGSIQLWATAADGTAYTFTPFASEGDGNFVELEVDTEPGALCLFMSSMQGRDGAPVGLVWEGAVLEGYETTSDASITTDLATIAASKLVVSGASETARANFSVSDGRAGLLLSIPPAAPSAPAAIDIRAWLSSGDTAYSAALTGQVARVQLIAAEFDRDAQEIRVSLNGGPPAVTAWSGSANPTEGPLVTGAGLLDGVVQPGGNLRMLGMLASTAILNAAEKERAEQWLAQTFAPVVTPVTTTALTGAVATIDLSPGVKDPSNWGWQITALEIDPIFAAAIADEHRISLDLTTVTAGTIEFRVQVASKHPLAPSTPLSVTIQLGSLALAPISAEVVQDSDTLLNVLGGATDAAGKALILAAVSDPDHGTTRIESGSVRYTPDAGYVGTDSFVVTARSESGGSVQASVSITVTPLAAVQPPVAAFSANPLSGKPPLKVQYTDESLNAPTSWLWDFGGGNTSTLQHPSFTYQQPGKKHVKLTATNSAGSSELTKTGMITVEETAASTGTINVSANSTPDLMPVLWEHTPLSSDVGKYNNNPAIVDYIRANWAGAGSTGVFDGHQSNTIKQTSIVLAPDGVTPCYRLHDRVTTGKDSDAKNWRASQIGVKYKGNGGKDEAFTQFDLWVPKDFNNYVDSASKNPDKLGAVFKLFWLFWGGPWNGQTVDDVSPASGGASADNINDFSIRAQCNHVSGSKGTKTAYKGYLYIKGKPSSIQFGGDTPYSPPMNRDAWNTIKAYLKLNTVTKGVSDDNGILRLWLNGNMFVNMTGLNVVGTENWKIQGCGVNHFFGGNLAEAYNHPTQENDLYLANFKMGGR
ncbi:LamG-like jellyroll fold domain-containing protein [Geminicoccus roseus]|uniref:LamG-like jellyroll fold domain-containing protein n=1 Tax=Geminicoccus roseus TaxID=404900 RepID=UPI00041B7242|nr:LamG-like jellyroll fold domain-containing protein [Geminicoccus roseus]